MFSLGGVGAGLRRLRKRFQSALGYPPMWQRDYGLQGKAGRIEQTTFCASG
jgi:hypothetical protein